MKKNIELKFNMLVASGIGNIPVVSQLVEMICRPSVLVLILMLNHEEEY